MSAHRGFQGSPLRWAFTDSGAGLFWRVSANRFMPITLNSLAETPQQPNFLVVSLLDARRYPDQ